MEANAYPGPPQSLFSSKATETVVEEVFFSAFLGDLIRATPQVGSLLRGTSTLRGSKTCIARWFRLGVETMLWTSDVVKDPWFPLVKDPSEVCPSTRVMSSYHLSRFTPRCNDPT